MLSDRHPLAVAALTWTARLVAGAAFTVSGAAKMIDPWGFVIKIGEYLTAWGIDAMVPAGLVLFAAVGLSMLEFLTGVNLMVGSLRRVTVWVAAAIMAAMLPLSLYIALASPVEHCGCFGDLWVISNTATFLKNVLLSALVVWLLRFNRSARPLFAPSLQWIQIALGIVYVSLLGITGYHEQPLLDFRPYPEGGTLLPQVDTSGITFIYEKNGERREFNIDHLPAADSGWEYVDRHTPDEAMAAATFSIWDSEGNDLTEQLIGSTPVQLLMLVPDVNEAGISGTYIAGELHDRVTSAYGPDAFLAVTGSSAADVAEWTDLTMPDYPVYSAEESVIRTVARGKMAMVCLSSDTIAWKRTLGSLNPDIATSADELPTVYRIDGPHRFRVLTSAYAALLLLLLAASQCAVEFGRKRRNC